MSYSWKTRCVTSLLYILVVLPVLVIAQEEVVYGYEDGELNLLHNGGFEHELSDCWLIHRNCEGNRTNEENMVHTGEYALKIDNRLSTSAGVYQRLYVGTGDFAMKPNTNYYASVFIKLLNNATEDGILYTTVKLLHKFSFTQESEIPRVQGTRGRHPYQLADGRYRQLGSDFVSPENITDLEYFEIKVQVQPASVNYVVDSASLIEIPSWTTSDGTPRWRQELMSRIRRHRKREVNLRATFPKDFPLDRSSIMIRHTRHHFKFGTAVKGQRVARSGPMDERYKDFIRQHFNWAVFESDMKWESMELHPGMIDVGFINPALEWLLENNIEVRGHNLLWEIMARNPLWVQQMSGSPLHQAIRERIDFMMSTYSDRIRQWDVCNEFLNNHFYENAIGDPGLIFEEFERANQIDPNGEFCLSDYLIARSGFYASAQMELAKTLLERGYNVGCVGVMSHLRSVPLPIERLDKRIQIASQAGLPIYITELTVHAEDVMKRAEALEQAVMVYYSQPAVNGIMLWTFSDLPEFTFENHTALTTGENFEMNEAGEVFFDLIEKRFCTRRMIYPTTLVTDDVFEAYHGDHKAYIKVDNQIVHEVDFVVDNSDTSPVNVDIVVPAGLL